MRNISEIRRSNVRQIIQDRKMTRSEFAEKVGIAYSQLAQYIGENPTKNIGNSVAQRIEKSLGLSENWLDQDWSINNGIIVGGNNINSGTQIGQQNNYDNAEPVQQQKIKIAPALNSIQAGKFTGIGDNTYDEYLPYFGDYGDDNVYWLKISGNSMYPDFKDGEYVLINKDRQAVAGNYVAALKHSDEEATFKKYRPKGYDNDGVEYFHLVPSNEEFPIIDSRFEPFVVLGVAVERNQKLV